LLPATVVNWFSAGESMRWLKDIASTLTPGQPIYVMLYATAIIFFCFFYPLMMKLIDACRERILSRK
jgi:preprotein translocase subunit SecY